MTHMITEKILLIDDDADDQVFFSDALKGIGGNLDCKTAGNGLEGLNLLNTGFVPDVIFLDLNMPHMNGFEFLRALRAKNECQGIPVVIFTTSSHQRDIDLSQELGAQAFLTKPNTLQNLRDSIRQLITADLTEFSQQMQIF